MANFTPSKKTAQDFNNGVEYIDGYGTTMGDSVHAESINNVIEGFLYAQDKAETAIVTANNALDKINEAISENVVPNGNYPNMTVGKSMQAAKLQTAQLIDGVEFDGTAQVAHYGVCSTAAGTAAKTVSLAGFALVAGARITVNFTTPNTVSSPTLNVNDTGAVAMKCKTRTTGLAWQAEIMTLIYDGTNWCIIGGYSLADKPVGSHKIQYQGESAPAALYGGTWSIDTDYTGRVLVGSGTGFTLGATGGSADAILIQHTHGTSIGIHGGAYNDVQSENRNWANVAEYSNTWNAFGTDGVSNNPAVTASGAGRNMQPYKVVGVWKRTA